MKNLIVVFIIILTIYSCGTEEYPKFYKYDSDVDVSSVFLTADIDGNIIEVEKIRSIENLGLTQIEFFTMSSGILRFNSITLNSETQATLQFNLDDPNHPIGEFVDVEYSGDEISEFGLVLGEDEVRQRGCYTFNVGENTLSTLSANQCTDTEAKDIAIAYFQNQDFGVNDTLAYSIIDNVYIRSN